MIIFEEVMKNISHLNKENFKPLLDLDIPKEQGVYIIKENKGIKEKKMRFFNGDVFYVGISTNLRVRIKYQHNSKSNKVAGSMLRIKLKKKGLKYNEICDYLENYCTFKFLKIEDYDLNSVIEMILIYNYRKSGKPLLNKIKNGDSDP